MGDRVALTVEERTVLGKKVKKLRKEGSVPGVVYGHDFESKAVLMPVAEADRVWREVGSRQPVQLTIGDAKLLAMIKSADFDPVKRNLRHLSFHIVKQDEQVQTEVPVHIIGTGETEAEKAGLVVLKAIEIVEISALPGDLPEFVEVSGDKLIAEGDHVTVADIKLISGVQITTDPAIVVATVYEPSALAAQNEDAAGEAEEAKPAEGESGAASEAGSSGDEAKAETTAEKSSDK